MPLKEIEEKLYKREGEAAPKKSIESRNLGQEPPQKNISRTNQSGEEPFAPVTLNEDVSQEKGARIKATDEKKAKRKKILKTAGLLIGVAAFVSAAVWGALWWRKTAFSEDKVKVSISGPREVKSGDMAMFEIAFSNLNRAALKDAVLYLNYPENFKPSGNLQFETEGPAVSKYNIGTIEKNESKKVSVEGKFFGPKDFLTYVEARLEYKSSTFNSVFTAEERTSVFIASNPLFVEIAGPINVTSGGGVSYVITYENSGEEEIKNLKLKVQYPSGFTFSNSDPVPATDDNIWHIGDLSSGQKGDVRISGSVKGFVDEIKTVKVFAGEFGSDNDFVSYGEAETQAKIVGSVIAITQTMNGEKENITVNAGEVLRFKIHFENTGSIGLRNVVLTEEISSSILDYSRQEMKDGKGSLNSRTGVITWKASDVPQLAVLDPGESGEIEFSIPVKEIIPVESHDDKNFSVKATARMDSPDIPTPEGMNKIIPSNSLEIKLNSKLLLTEEGFYNDPEIANIGPLPLKVNEETTFAIHVKVTSVSSDVTDAKVVATLAPGVSWKNNFLPGDSAVSYNGRSNEVTWDIGTLIAGTGILTTPKEMIFQVGITPSENQVGSFPPLVSKTTLSAKDAYTGTNLETELPSKTTNLQEDISVGSAGKVER